jgi:hypothetical protein
MSRSGDFIGGVGCMEGIEVHLIHLRSHTLDEDCGGGDTDEEG